MTNGCAGKGGIGSAHSLNFCVDEQLRVIDPILMLTDSKI
jgi:hypothetical protein